MVDIKIINDNEFKGKCENVEVYGFYQCSYAEIVINNEVVGKIWGLSELKNLKKILNSLDI